MNRTQIANRKKCLSPGIVCSFSDSAQIHRKCSFLPHHFRLEQWHLSERSILECRRLGVQAELSFSMEKCFRGMLEDEILTVPPRLQTRPFFESTPPQNVSALIGKTAFLTCVVRNLGKAKSVTWIRHRDVHILTVGEYTYTTDQRFVARHNRATDEWVLVIKYVQDRDAGTYACQIPSSPPRSFPVNLNIIGESNISFKSIIDSLIFPLIPMFKFKR